MRKKSRLPTMTLREAKARFSEVVVMAQDRCVLVTKRGKPAALVIGGKDLVAAIEQLAPDVISR
jgi:prevent-host-death family protein